MTPYKCLNCNGDFTAREADRKRGWAKFCSKSCKAKEQERRTGQHNAYLERRNIAEDDIAYHVESAGWDAHKDVM